MQVKVKKKPVRKSERANGIRLRVHYNGIKIAGKYYTFGKAENLWKYVGSTVNVVKNKVFDSNGIFLGDINAPNALFGRKVRCILKRLPETIVVDNGVEFVRMELIMGMDMGNGESKTSVIVAYCDNVGANTVYVPNYHSSVNEEKRALFREAVQFADKAKYKLSDIHALPELRKTLTDKQLEAIAMYKEAFCELLGVYQELESGRSE